MKIKMKIKMKIIPLALALLAGLEIFGGAAFAAEKNWPVKITAGEKVLTAAVFDSRAGRDFLSLLPLRAALWEPADFAKAFDLERRLSNNEEVTRSYEVGGLAYWPEGPAMAIFFSGHRAQTVVPVITIGKITEGAEMFKDYSGEILIERNFE